MEDAPARLPLLRHLLATAKIKPLLELGGSPDRTVAFARTVDGSAYWITLKTGSPAGSRFNLKVHGLVPGANYLVKDLLGGAELTISGQELGAKGAPASLAGNGSTVYFVEKAGTRR
jgi:hypothetical protein